MLAEIIAAMTLLLTGVLSLYTTQPVWVTSPYVRAGSENVISVTTNETTLPVPTHRFFFSTPLTGTPNLGYGIKAYEGYDYLGEEMFEVNRTYLDRFQFRVLVQIIGTTNILRLNVPYIAIDPTFPHHLNSFDNVPVNYSAGLLTGISTTAPSSTYVNTINYTQQAAGLNYTTFQAPFSRNKILLFMTSIFFYGTNERNNPPPYRPVNLSVSAEVISVDQYVIQVNLTTEVNISRLHFSMIIFDQTDVESSGLYLLVYEKVTLPYTGGFIPVPIQFVDNFILGFLEFTSNKTCVILDFQWDYQTINGTHGANMIQSVGQTNKLFGTQTINTVTYTLFYIKTWICPNQTFFDPSLNLCTGCPIINCINCYNISVCSTCDELHDFFLNTTSLQCVACSLEGCINCTSLAICQQCNHTAGYALVGTTCFKCSTVANTFLNTSTNQCQLCSLAHCLTCVSLTQCQVCDTNASYYLPTPTSPCTYCDSSANYFINSTSLLCEECLMEGCLLCDGLGDCGLCDGASGYWLDGVQCTYDCALIANCTTNTTNNTNNSNSSSNSNSNGRNGTQSNTTNNGTNNTNSSTDSNSTANTANSTIDNSTNSTNSSSDNSTTNSTGNNTYTTNSSTDTNSSNTTDNTNYTTNSTNSTNDNNSTNSTNSTNYTASPLIEPLILDYSSDRAGCNSFTLSLPLPNSLDSWCLEQAESGTPGVHITAITPLDTHLQYQLSYTTDIYNQTLQLLFPCHPAVFSLSFTYSSMLPPLYYNETQCAAHESIKDLLQAVEVISYVILIMSLLTCKIVGLELFGVLQLAYFSLASHDFYNIYLYPLTGFKTFNGLNIPFISQSSHLPNNLQEMKVSANFLNNCNIMLILLFAQLIISTILYIVSRAKKMKKLNQVSIRMLKQGFISLVLFNLFNVAFSIGADYKYSQHDASVDRIYNIIVMVVTTLAVAISTIAMEMTSPSGYGQFKDKFKDSCTCRVYILISAIYRVGLGLYIVLHNEYPESTLLVLSVSLAFIMYNIINLPFSQPVQNYRCNLIHLTQLVTLVSANYYREMKMNTPMQVKARIYFPAFLELVMIVLCIGVSAMVLLHEIYVLVRDYRHKGKVGTMGNKKNAEESNETISQFNQ